MSNDYAKGFNDGYLMTEHAPELARALSKVESNAPRMEGFRDGRREWVLEQTKTRVPEREQRRTEPTKDRGLDLER